MTSASGLPSLIIFGPHTDFPVGESLEELRQELNSVPRLSALSHAVSDLPRFWNSLVDFDTELRQIPGVSYLGQLGEWLRDGGCLPHNQSDAPNHYGLAVTILLQISQYSCFLNHLGKDSHPRVLRSVESGGIQGFCSGFLNAIAIASSETEVELGSAAAVALRLAVCIGAYVDLDGIYSQKPEKYSCVVIRWKKTSSDGKAEVASMIESFPNVRCYLPLTNFWNSTSD